MCGIIGCISNTNYNLSKNTFIDINNMLLKRGPDNQSTTNYNNEKNSFNFGHTRLSIQDLNKRANQPMFSKDKNLIILFNGEIYNHLELRNNYFENYSWSSSSDTETLLVMFERFGIDKTLNLIDGMFAISLYNKSTNELVLIRDRAGEKPLYFGLSDSFFIFSSDTKTFLKFKNFDKSICNEAVEQYLKLNYIKSPLCIYKNAFKLPPGSYIKINLNKYNFCSNINFSQFINLQSIEFNYWWKLENKINLTKKSYNYQDTTRKVEDLLISSVKQQQISDVPIGVFLSGGIDSSLITSIMSSISSEVNTFTIGFEDKIFDEARYANNISNYLGTKHTEILFQKNDLLNIIPKLSYVYTEPFADSSQIPSLLLSQTTSKKVKVALSGDGGDELFAGYNRYSYGLKYEKLISHTPDLFKKIFYLTLKYSPRSLTKNILNLLLNSKINSIQEIDKITNKMKVISNDSNFYDAMISEWTAKDKILNSEIIKDSFNNAINIKKSNKLNLLDYMMISDFNSYLCDDILCKMDRASMYHSLEVRTPFLNKDLIEFSFNLPYQFKINKRTSKKILKDILSNYLPKNLFERKKSGFAVPIASFLKKELKEWAGDMLSAKINNKHKLFNQSVIEKAFKDHLDGNINNEHKLWSIIQFNSWFENIYNG